MNKITHDQVRNILNKIYYYCEDIPRQEELEQYILQQEKQEKLLELYKEVSNYVCEQCYVHEFPKINGLKILIKELEK